MTLVKPNFQKNLITNSGLSRTKNHKGFINTWGGGDLTRCSMKLNAIFSTQHTQQFGSMLSLTYGTSTAHVEKKIVFHSTET